MGRIQLSPTLSSVSTEIGQIYTTQNYDMFETVVGNRQLNETNKKKLRKSIQNGGYIRSSAIICAYDPNNTVKPLKILDGNHRFDSGKHLNVPISYTITDEVDINNPTEVKKLIIRLNTASKTWDIKNYMEAYGSLNNQNYVLYKELYDSRTRNNRYDHDTIFFILSKMKGRNVDFETFKHEDFSFTVQDKAKLEQLFRVFDRVLTVTYTDVDGKKISAVDKIRKRQFFKALFLYMRTPNFNLEHFMRKLSISENILNKCDNVEEATKMIRTIYNHCSRTKYVNLTQDDEKGITITIKKV